MSLEELLRLYEENLGRYEPKTAATRRSILKAFRESWSHGLGIPVRTVSTGQLELWLGSRGRKVSKVDYLQFYAAFR